MQRPTGVAIVAILMILGGIFGILGGRGGVGLARTLMAETGNSALSTVLISNAVLLIVSVIQLIVGYGLWFVKPWAWTVGVVVIVLRVAADLIAMFNGQVTTGSLGLIISLVILWYFFRPNVKSAFGR